MTSERIKEIQETTAYPESVSVMFALKQVWNECEQERAKNSSMLDVASQREVLLAWEKYKYGSEWSMVEDQIVPSIDEYLNQ